MGRSFITYHIIGGGVAGLAAARFIKQKNIENKVILYEAAHKLGGRCCSFFDTKLDRKIDNATHVILGANRNVRELMGKLDFQPTAKFWSNGEISSKFWNFKDLILRSIFNTQANEVAKPLVRSLMLKLFPFLPYKLKSYYSRGDLSDKLIEPLSRYIDELKLDYILQGFEAEKKKIIKLKFNKEEIEIGKKDKIICALDAANYSKVFQGPEFEFNEICNVFFRTSTALSLPNDLSYIATPDNLGDWIFINDDVVAVTISDSGLIDAKDEELARILWREIRSVKGLNPAFMPPYRVFRYKQATIKQDGANNKKRPNSANSAYNNMRIAGDWTMKKLPCSLESAVLSAKRAVN